MRSIGMDQPQLPPSLWRKTHGPMCWTLRRRLEADIPFGLSNFSLEWIGGQMNVVVTDRHSSSCVGLGERSGRRDRQGRSHSSNDGAVYDHGQASRSGRPILYATEWRNG